MYVLTLRPPLEEQTTELLSNISPSIMEGKEEDGDHQLHLREPVKYYFTYLVHKGGEKYLGYLGPKIPFHPCLIRFLALLGPLKAM